MKRELMFFVWRCRVSWVATWRYHWSIGAYGFADDDMDRRAFYKGKHPHDYFMDAWLVE